MPHANVAQRAPASQAVPCGPDVDAGAAAPVVAGIDVGKRRLDVARVGLEPSGHYEAAVAAFLRARGFSVIVVYPGQVHGFRRFRQRRAKTDPIDAALIAAAAASVDTPRDPPDPRLVPLAEQLTALEQLGEDFARLKVRRERFADPAILRDIAADIARLDQRRARITAGLLTALRALEGFAERLRLLRSISGIGAPTAIGLLIHMPELGRLTRATAAALAGLASFNRDSGQAQGPRHIAGGRTRARRYAFLAAFSAQHRWNPALKASYERLRAAGKHHTLATVASARKLVVLANAVLARGTPWQHQPPARDGHDTVASA